MTKPLADEDRIMFPGATASTNVVGYLLGSGKNHAAA